MFSQVKAGEKNVIERTNATETWADREKAHAFCMRTNTKKHIQQSSLFAEWALMRGTIKADLPHSFELNRRRPECPRVCPAAAPDAVGGLVGDDGQPGDEQPAAAPLAAPTPPGAIALADPLAALASFEEDDDADADDP